MSAKNRLSTPWSAMTAAALPMFRALANSTHAGRAPVMPLATQMAARRALFVHT